MVSRGDHIVTKLESFLQNEDINYLTLFGHSQYKKILFDSILCHLTAISFYYRIGDLCHFVAMAMAMCVFVCVNVHVIENLNFARYIKINVCLLLSDWSASNFLGIR